MSPDVAFAAQEVNGKILAQPFDFVGKRNLVERQGKVLG
jgi:hypothetical protein